MRIEYGDCRDCFYWSDEKTSVCTNDKCERYGKQITPVVGCESMVKQFTLDDLLAEEAEEEAKKQK